MIKDTKKRLLVSLNKDLIDELDRVCQIFGVSKSDYISFVLAEDLKLLDTIPETKKIESRLLRILEDMKKEDTPT